MNFYEDKGKAAYMGFLRAGFEFSVSHYDADLGKRIVMVLQDSSQVQMTGDLKIVQLNSIVSF